MYIADNFLGMHNEGINAFTLSNRLEVLDVAVLCLHLSIIVTSLRVYSDVLSKEGSVDLKLGILI